MADEQTWICTRCLREQAAGTIMTFPATVDGGGAIRLISDAPACCPHCAEILPAGPHRFDVLMRYLGAVPRVG